MRKKEKRKIETERKFAAGSIPQQGTMKNLFQTTTVKNRIFALAGTILAALIVLCAFCWNNTFSQTISSSDDGALTLDADTPGFIQSFQADNRNITGIKLYLDSVSEDAQGTLKIAVYDSADALGQTEDSNDGGANLPAAYEPDEGAAIASASVSMADLAGRSEYSVSMTRHKLNPGHRYFLTVELTDVSEGTSLGIRTWSDHAGLSTISADGKTGEAAGAVRAEVLYSRASNPAFLLKLLITFGGIAFALAAFSRRTWDETLAVSMGIICIWLIICGVFGILNFGVTLLMIVSSVLFILTPTMLMFRGKPIKDIITPGFIGFWCLMLAYFILDRNTMLSKVDDLNHWMLTVTDMWYSDAFAFHAGSVVAFPRYTPAAAVIEYLFLRLAGYYREGLILYALNAIGFVYLGIMFARIPWKHWHKAIPTAMIAVCLPALIYSNQYNYVHVDAYLGIAGAYMLICWFTEERATRFNVLRITAAGIVLSMIKESGYVIAMTNWLIIAADIFFHTYKHSWKAMWKRGERTWRAFWGAIATMLSYPLWNVYCIIKGGLGKSGITIVLKKLLGIGTMIVRAAEADQPEITQSASPGANPDTSPLNVIKELVHWMLRQKDYLNKSFFDIFLLLILFVMLFAFCGLFKPIRLRMKELIGYLIFGTAVYTAFMAVCYMTLFKEASAIPAARRYMGSYLLLIMFTLLGVILVRLNQTEWFIVRKKAELAGPGENEVPEEKKDQDTEEIYSADQLDYLDSKLRMPLITMFLVWFASALIFLSVPNSSPLYMTADIGDELYQQWGSNRVLRETIRSFAEEGEYIYFVSYEDSTIVPKYNYLMFFNAVAPVHAQGLNGGWKPVEEYEEQYYTYAKIMSSEEWGQMLADKYDYVYIHDIDDYFPEHYGSLFENEDDIMNGGIYKVIVNDDGSVKLHKIAYKDLN